MYEADNGIELKGGYGEKREMRRQQETRRGGCNESKNISDFRFQQGGVCFPPPVAYPEGSRRGRTKCRKEERGRGDKQSLKEGKVERRHIYLQITDIAE